MTVRPWFVALGFVIGLMQVPPLLAEEFVLTITDQHQQPLENVVVELAGDNRETAPNTTPAVVDQVNKQFLPGLRVIQVGQQVSFPNSDNIRHHVYSFSPAKPFELKLYAGKPKQPVLFDQPGVVVLGCNIHDSMVGYIYIARGQTAVSNAQGEARLQLEHLPDTVYVWHANQAEGPEQRHLQTLHSNRTLIIPTVAPEPRDTFGAKFGAGSEP